MRKKPGLVADGRDMGFIFETRYRFFLTASPQKRAERRVLEFLSLDKEVNYEQILKDIIERDLSDQNNPVNRLRPHEHAHEIDTTNLTREEVAQKIIDHCDYLDFVMA
jgi:cytidylate kinase